MSQRGPVKFGGQVHLKPSPGVNEHVAPFSHGLLVQASKPEN
jgi:hypothetical protein